MEVSGRRRAEYTITAAGRKVLRQWLAEPGGGFTVESESLLKVLFADAGTKEQLLATVRSIRDEVIKAHEAIILNNAREWVAVGPAFPERAHVSALVGDCVSRIHLAVIEWAEAAEARVAQWPDVRGSQARIDEAIAMARELFVEEQRP